MVIQKTLEDLKFEPGYRLINGDDLNLMLIYIKCIAGLLNNYTFVVADNDDEDQFVYIY